MFTDAKRQINERERGTMEAANHLMFSQLFYDRNIKLILFSEANYSTFFLKYAHFESVCEWERLNVRVLVICICLSLQTLKLWI